MPTLKNTFLLGVATPTGGFLTINGSTVPQYANGGYLAFVPVEPGSFTFHLEYRVGASSAAFDRHVFIEKPLQPSPAKTVAIDREAMLPDADVELQAGDYLYTQVKGTPLVRAEVKVDGSTGWLPMIENRGVCPGLYQAAIPIGPGFAAKRAAVKFRLRRGFFHRAKAEAAGKVTAPAPFRVVETSTDTVYIRTAPDQGYMLFPLRGTRFVSDARLGNELRVRLSPAESGWGFAGSLRALPEGTLPPEAVLGSMKTTLVSPRETWVKMDVGELVPTEVIEEGEWVHVRLHNTVSHSNWVVYDSSDTFVREVRWRQEDARTVRVSVRLDPASTLWGWRLVWDGALDLVLRRPPPVDVYQAKPFKGISILLDPGHSPGKNEGAVGPMGTRESEINMGIALEVKKLLEDDGAQVFLTREGTQERGLGERPRMAWESRADLFISIHNNALPDGANPFNPPRGFMIFYYHPHSMALARAVHRAYMRGSRQVDEGLRFGNLLVARESGMPAILTESDYLIYPERELHLLQPEYQKQLAKLHRDGVYEFLKAFSKPPPPPPKAGPPPAPPKPQAKKPFPPKKH